MCKSMFLSPFQGGGGGGGATEITQFSVAVFFLCLRALLISMVNSKCWRGVWMIYTNLFRLHLDAV